MPAISLIGAASSIGIRPYDDGTQRHLDGAPNALRAQELVRRLRAQDRGDVTPPPYRDFTRPPGAMRNAAEVDEYSRALAHEIARALREHTFALTLGGDCSIVLGCLLGVRAAVHPPVGLVYIDAHADFATPATSRTGSAASMCLALAVGHGDTPLARLDDAGPLVAPENVVVIGRRDDADAVWYGHAALRERGVVDLPHSTVRAQGPAAVAAATLDHVARARLNGFWIHIDADVLDPSVLPAVDSPEPDGLTMDELIAIVRPLARHSAALGLELTIYDPGLDPERTSAARLADFLERALVEDFGS